MKKTRVLILGGLFFGAGLAHAQSSVTLYGVADVGISYLSNVNGSSTFLLRSGV
ncbi:porin [Paraburkholderia susongensis]|uniref:Porin n=1 Tax=Paraburkholderia susongensis TaxID=1515439 RepID=A0A1X7LQH6_9BURK|nr:porin [Paraburkholderia susongensis]